MSGALVAAIMAPRIVATITRTIYAEDSPAIVQAGETWAVVHSVGPGGTPSISDPDGTTGGNGGVISTLIPVSPGDSLVLSSGITLNGAAVHSASGGSSTGVVGSTTRFTGVAYTSPVSRVGTGSTPDPLDPGDPENAGQSGIGLGGARLFHEVSPGNNVGAVRQGGASDGLVTFYTGDPR